MMTIRNWTRNETGRRRPYEKTSTVPPRNPNSSLHRIISKRNLEDFARLWIDLSGATDALDWGMQIGLKWKNVTGAPAINIYPSADGDGSTSYLTDEAAAQSRSQEFSMTPFGTRTTNKRLMPTAHLSSSLIIGMTCQTIIRRNVCSSKEQVKGKVN